MQQMFSVLVKMLDKYCIILAGSIVNMDSAGDRGDHVFMFSMLMFGKSQNRFWRKFW